MFKTKTPHNPNFSNNEFNLYDTIQNEVVQKRGIDVIYLPKQFQKVDLILGEDVLSKFDASYKMKMYLTSYSGFEGDGDVFGHFGLVSTNQANFEVNMNEFRRQTNLLPNEGDLIYVPVGEWIMEIFMIDDDKEPFFALGQQSKYVILTRKYEYSNEEMDTGIDVIDGLNDLQTTDIESENDAIELDSDDILNSADTNIFGDK